MTSTTQVADRLESYVAHFEAFRREPGFGPAWLRSAREAAFSQFLERGFPTSREEEWKFTNVRPIADTAFVRPDHRQPLPSRQELQTFLFDGSVGTQIVLVNGRVIPELTSLDALPAGVTLSTLHEAFPEAPRRGPVPRLRSTDFEVRTLLTPQSIGTGNPFVSLNTAFFEDALVLHVAPKTVVERPIHVLFVTADADGRPVLVLPRFFVVVGEQSQVSIVESFASLGTNTMLTNTVTEIMAGAGAVVDHVKLQRESAAAFHTASMFLHLHRSSTCASRALSFGGRIARNDIVAVLAGEGAECTLNGLYVAGGQSLIDTHTTIDHAQPHCPSHEVYKGILGGHAKAVFNGKIIVRPDAQKTDAKQTNKALLLSDSAQINTKPQLEIFADDVKCTHGAAIGQLDEDAMFYLRARGIAEVDAKSLLIHAFAAEVLDGVKVDAVRARAFAVLEEQLAIAHQQDV